MSLASFFNSGALVFFDIVSGGKPDTLYKVVSYIPQYDPNLNSALYNVSSNPLPYRELYSAPQGKIAAKPFRGHVSGTSSYAATLQELRSNSCFKNN